MKAAKILLLAAAALMAADFAFAQTWIQQTNAPSKNWASVASSADGSKLVAVAYIELGGIYTSTNSGVTWTQTNAAPVNLAWSSVASSADGTKLVALADSYYPEADFQGGIYISTNSGVSWFQTSAPSGNTDNWSSVASSADGCKLVAVMQANDGADGGIYTSTDSGADWTLTSAPNTNWISVASSADGTKLAAVVGRFESSVIGGIYTSTNSGADWTLTSAPITYWNSIASSADGNTLVVAGNGIYISTNSGASWFQTFSSTSLLQAFQSSVASSADGNKLVAVLGGVGIYTWPWPLPFPPGKIGWKQQTNAPAQSWTSVASSADGSKLVAVVMSGGIWTSQTTPSPRLNITPTNGSFKFSWIIPSTNFVMQQSSDLSSWSGVTNMPVLNLTNLQNEVFLSPTGSSGFYRLSTP
jgi:hypothetical protein